MKRTPAAFAPAASYGVSPTMLSGSGLERPVAPAGFHEGMPPGVRVGVVRIDEVPSTSKRKPFADISAIVSGKLL
jgi:hypothetical protein